jgi:hypothetical protein
MKRIKYLLLSLFLVYAAGCKEEGRLDHIDDQAAAPMPVTLDKVINKPGGAVIKYSVPDDENLLGVKAVYTRNGEICETKASLFVDSLTVEGFGDTQVREIKLYSVGRNEKLSEPLTVQITPLTPAVSAVLKDIDSGFGGVIVSLSSNVSNANLALVLLIDTTETGIWAPLQTFYTQAGAMKFSRRGLDNKEQKFALYIRDRWNNKSDTLVKLLTPIEEIKISKTTWVHANFPGDTYAPAENQNNYRLDRIWEGTEAYTGPFFASQFSAPMPQHFTINLGQKVVLSRFKMWPRSNEMYAGSSPRTFEVWGAENPPSNDSFDDWHLLGQWNQLKPSGYGEGTTVGPITSEDQTYFRGGGDYELVPNDLVPDPYIPITHLRFRITSTFTTYGSEATQGQVIIGELTFWGQLKN